MRRMWTFCIMLCALVFSPMAVYALDLDTARANGQVIELHTGYLKAGAGASSSALTLVQQVNAKRKALYQDVASRDGVPLSDVEQIFGDKIFAKGQPGVYERIDGTQIRK